MKTTDAARLLTTIRKNDAQVGLLAIEVLLLVATGPKTREELQRITDSAAGPISRAIRSFVPWHQRSSGLVIEPRLPLLKRVKRPGRKAPVISLSRMGCLLLRENNLIPGARP
jgi:hypothetical protein